jgi:hypothetical protein
MRKQLLGIKERAEAHPQASREPAEAAV